MIYNSDFWEPILLSLKVSGIAMVFVIFSGIVIGKWMSSAQFSGKTLLETVFLMPIVLPPTVLGFLLIILFSKTGFFGKILTWIFNQSIMFTWWAAMISSAIVAFPLMYQSVKTGFENVDRDIEDAARVDGAGKWQLLAYISLPLCQRAIFAGIILSFTRALGEFGATFMFAGNIPGKTQTVPLAIYLAFETGNMHLAWAWVISIIIFSFFLLIVLRIIQK